MQILSGHWCKYQILSFWDDPRFISEKNLHHFLNCVQYAVVTKSSFVVVHFPTVSSPLLRLSPPPSERDYFFRLDENEGVCDLFDIPIVWCPLVESMFTSVFTWCTEVLCSIPMCDVLETTAHVILIVTVSVFIYCRVSVAHYSCPQCLCALIYR